MSNALIIFKQTVIMFLYMTAGFTLFRAKLITREGSASMANLLLYIIIPSVLIQSFQVDYSPVRARELLVSAALLFLPFPGLPGAMKTALYIAAMAPVGANAAVYAQKQGRDYSYAVGLVCLSTLFSVVTMPLLILLAR